MSLAEVVATRYVAPLREGGSLPGIVEADDLGTYVVKFRGAGQGLPVLVAEVIVAGLARALGLRTPRLVCVDLRQELVRYEADEEVQDLLSASLGSNLGSDFLPGSFGFDQSVDVESDLAAAVLFLDAFVANVDRSWRNPNLLMWHGDLWLIDHGAALYFHHGWTAGPGDPARFAAQPFSLDDHIFASHADRVAGLADGWLAALDDDVLEQVVAEVPDAWLERDGVTPSELRAAYVDFLRARRDGARPWLPAVGA